MHLPSRPEMLRRIIRGVKSGAQAPHSKEPSSRWEFRPPYSRNGPRGSAASHGGFPGHLDNVLFSFHGHTPVRAPFSAMAKAAHSLGLGSRRTRVPKPPCAADTA